MKKVELYPIRITSRVIDNPDDCVDDQNVAGKSRYCHSSITPALWNFVFVRGYNSGQYFERPSQ